MQFLLKSISLCHSWTNCVWGRARRICSKHVWRSICFQLYMDHADELVDMHHHWGCWQINYILCSFTISWQFLSDVSERINTHIFHAHTYYLSHHRSWKQICPPHTSSSTVSWIPSTLLSLVCMEMAVAVFLYIYERDKVTHLIISPIMWLILWKE